MEYALKLFLLTVLITASEAYQEYDENDENDENRNLAMDLESRIRPGALKTGP